MKRLVTIGVYGWDRQSFVGKRSRVELAAAYRDRYTREILDAVDLAPIVGDELPGAGSAALFCVERDPEACHRSIIAARMAAAHGVVVRHLVP